MALLCCWNNASAQTENGKSVKVELKNARRTIEYQGALVVDGTELTLKDKELVADGSNQIAVLVVNGGKLVLDHCKIVKTGDGKRTGNSEMRNDKKPDFEGGGSPEGEKERPQGQRSERKERPDGQRAEKRQRPGGGGGMNADDGFNFYGLNSAVVAVGEESEIQMISCEVETNAEYANAVFSCDGATINITEGIKIRTEKGSSRGLYATCAGNVKAEGVVDISTKGTHCAALATDRGGGTVVVGHPGTQNHSMLYTAGQGSPCIYSTGDIFAYNAEGEAGTSQTMVVEGKNSITIEDCSFSGNSPQHGGIMLYQSTSGDAAEGTSVLNMKDCTIKDNSGTSMILITNTHSIVNMDNCQLLNKEGKALADTDAMIVCKNCNADGGHHWGKEGSNGGQVEVNLTNQRLQGMLLANEEESSITITKDKQSNVKSLKTLSGRGKVVMK